MRAAKPDRRAVAGLTVLLFVAAVARAQELTELTLEDLMEIEVTSVSRKPQTLVDTATAVYIITARDIERSSATTLPELLRRVPGLHVARLESSGWAVTSRGFNHRYASKMLVAIDGRAVYTPLFAGVYWDAQDVLLANVERIEIIRGPGATMWGENAVNGVINIITKPAAATVGSRLEVIGGSEEAMLAFRHGGSLGSARYRVSGRGYRQDAVGLAEGTSAGDPFHGASASLRIDLGLGGSADLALDAQVYGSETRQHVEHASLEPPYAVALAGDRRISGGYIGGRLQPFEAADASFFGYVDRTRREGPDGFVELRDTYELDYQQRAHAGGRHDLVWGGQFRATTDAFEDTFRVALEPESRMLHVASGFVQDELALARDRVLVTAGSKVSHNTFTGLEVQPSLRALLKLDARQAIWGAVSRAVRTPSRVETDMRVNAAVLPQADGPPVLVALFGSDIEPERLVAYEAGYRARGVRASVDVAAFFNRYDGLTTTELSRTILELEPAPAHVLVPILLENGGPARTSGIEALLRASPLQNLELQGWYSWFRLGEGFQQDAPAEGALIPEGGVAAVPAHQARLDARVGLGEGVFGDASVHYVGAVETQDIPSYLRLDARLAWRLSPALEVSFAGQNLLQDRHPEFAGEQSRPPLWIERAFLARAVWTF